MKIDYQEIVGKPNSIILQEIADFYQTIFETTDINKFYKRIELNENLFTVLAFFEDKIIGFKVGYMLDSTTFYSWIGGVKTDYRKLGIAQELMNRQHNWCIKNGFQKVITKTQNSFKPMLILNIKNGFNIIEVYAKKPNEHKIVLEKSLIN